MRRGNREGAAPREGPAGGGGRSAGRSWGGALPAGPWAARPSQRARPLEPGQHRLGRWAVRRSKGQGARHGAGSGPAPRQVSAGGRCGVPGLGAARVSWLSSTRGIPTGEGGGRGQRTARGGAAQRGPHAGACAVHRAHQHRRAVLSVRPRACARPAPKVWGPRAAVFLGVWGSTCLINRAACAVPEAKAKCGGGARALD
ncbi:MAG: hypothetical protein J3K34DRAFT_421801 [Monoraphidium minutum]|nr:MAG: hypothetical protein J3K34DRAFT_421801 [Monoraphidium minutum]